MSPEWKAAATEAPAPPPPPAAATGSGGRLPYRPPRLVAHGGLQQVTRGANDGQQIDPLFLLSGPAS